MDHKKGCLGDLPGCGHRVPIECVTREGLEKALAEKSCIIGELNLVIRDLKAKLYDLEHKDY